MKVFVFGGTGFIGSRIVKCLVQTGHAVSALARTHEKAETLKQMGASPHLGDLDKRETIRDVIKGSELIINAAFPFFLGRMTMGRVRRDSQEGFNQMKNLLDTISEIGKIPVILTEGSMAFGDSQSNWLDENSPYKFDKGHGRLLQFSAPYAQRMMTEKKLSIITMSLSGAYGPGTWFKESLYSYIKKGRGMVVGDGRNVWSFVHVDDVAEAYRLVVEKLPIGQTFTLADDEPCTYVDFANFIADQLGKPHVKRMPKWIANILLGSVLSEAMTMNQKVKNTKAKTQLGWKLKYPSYRVGIPAAIAEIETSSTQRIADNFAKHKK